MRIVAIIQARMGSTRLPGKVMRDLGGRTALARVIRRVQRFGRIDRVLIATSVEAADDVIVTEAEHCGAAVFRGNEDDVLDRYCQAARESRAEAVVRITSDCPLIDPGVSDDTIRQFQEQRPDYASNAIERTFPRGLDTEAMTVGALERAWREAREPYQRAHVTPYFYQSPDRFRVLSVKGEADYSGYRWTLDTPEDLEFLRSVYARFGGRDDFTWREVLELLQREPALAEMNKHILQKALHEG